MKPASSEIDIILDGKATPALDRSNLDVNQSFAEFHSRITDLLAKKTKLSKQAVQDATKTFQWVWMTLAQSQRKNLPRFNALETEEHYQQIQKDVRSTSRKNPELDNMVLRIHVAIDTKLPDDTSDIEVLEVVDLVGTRRRNVCSFTDLSDEPVPNFTTRSNCE